MKDTRRLHSGRVSVKQPSQVSSDRYQFLDLASAEPNLGTADNGSVLTTDTAGQRIWTANLALYNANVAANLAATRIYSDNIYFANGQPYITDVKNSNIFNGTATAGNNITLIDTLSAASLRSVRWVLSAKDNDNTTYKSSTIDALTDGESVYYNEYSVVQSGTAGVAAFTVAILSGNLNLYADGDSNNVTITFQRTTLDSTTVSGYVAGAGYIQSAVGSGTATTCVNDVFTGTGSQTNFTLSASPTDENQTLVSVGGVLQPKTAYAVSGTALTFGSAPASGVIVDVTTFVTTTITGYVGSRGYTGSAGLLTNWTKRTGNYTAANGDRIIADTSGGPFSIALPANPGTGHYVEITDGASFYTNPLTITPNGSTIEGQNVNVLVDTAAVDIQLIYDGATWQIVSTYGPMGYTGSAGPAGGYTGSAGSIGFTGSRGTTGFAGSQGVAGSLGYTGSAGVGFTGSAGAVGFTGSAATGVVGYSGSAGGAGIAGNLAITGSLTLGTWNTAGRPANPVAGQLGFNISLGYIEWYSSAASQWFPIYTPAAYNVEYLVIAGGGGGGWGGAGGGGGGGAGGYLSGVNSLNSGASYAIVVGAGGAGASSSVTFGVQGSGSSFAGISSATGGGAGAGSSTLATGGTGGSGGGGCAGGNGGENGAGGSAVTGQGNPGGIGVSQSGAGYAGGGGGGAGAVGGNSMNFNSGLGGNGGSGLAWSDGTTRAGGGGGGGNNLFGGSNGGTGGSGGGGNGGNGATGSGVTSGTANTGSGGGGNRAAAGAGGSGIVIIRYQNAMQRGTGGTVTQSGGYFYHTFTTSGTYTA